MAISAGLGTIIGASISGLTGIANGLMGGNDTRETNLAQMWFNEYMQKQAQAWQENMSNTAHQREVQDLRNAGLNPILSATGGTGASTGSVGASSTSLNNPAQYRQQAFQNGLQAISTMAQAKLQSEQANLARQQQSTEQTKQDLNVAETFFKMAEKLRTEKETSWIDRKNAKEMDYLGSQILLNQANVSIVPSIIKKNTAEAYNAYQQGIASRENAQSNRINADANDWYQRHRSLGYSYTVNGKFGPFSWGSGRTGGLSDMPWEY